MVAPVRWCLSVMNRTEEFQHKLKKVHPTLELIGEYINRGSKIKVKDKYGICSCIPSKLLSGQVPCIRTAVDPQEYFLNQVKAIHGDVFDYSKVNYKDSLNKIIIICKKHGEFKQRPGHHLKGQGCKKCTEGSIGSHWYKNTKNAKKSAVMYILQLEGNGESFKKFGVAINLEKRIEVIKCKTKNLYNITILKKVMNTAEYCYNLEQRFKKKIWRKRRTYIPKLKFGGMYECFKNH